MFCQTCVRELLVLLATPPLVTPVLLLAAVFFFAGLSAELAFFPADLAEVLAGLCFLAAGLVAALPSDLPLFLPLLPSESLFLPFLCPSHA